MAKRTMPDGTIVHTREGEPQPYTPTFSVEPGTDLLELLRPERAVERLEAEVARLRALLDAHGIPYAPAVSKPTNDTPA